MSNTYVLDTGIFVGYVRGAAYARHVDAQYGPLEGDNIALVSVVSHGELLSLAYQFGWGKAKRRQLQARLGRVSVTSIDHDEIIDRYAEIDAFSQGKLPEPSLPDGLSARNMGKNDLWIAATASVLDATLLTVDGDFDHLDGVFAEVTYIDPDADY